MDHRKELVYAWLNKQIKASKILDASLFDGKIRRTFANNYIQIYTGIKLISDILDIHYFEDDWDGNEHCHTNYVKRYIWYKNYQFFELVDKNEEEKENNEGQ